MDRWNVNKLILLLGAGLILLAAVINLVLVPSNAGMLVPLLPGILAAAVLLFWERPWFYLVAGILTAAFPLVVLFVFGASGAITHPGGGLDSLSILLLLVGAVLALLGGIMGFVQGRRNAHPGMSTWSRAPQSIVTLLLVGALLGFAAANGYATTAARAATELPTHYAESVDANVRVVTTGFAFAPKSLRLEAGKLTSIDLENEDPVLHTFSYQLADGEERGQPIMPNSKSSILLKFDTPRTFKVWCAPHSGGADDTSDEGMWMDVTVA